MKQEPDNYEDDRQNGGAVAWPLIACAMWTALLLIVLYLVGCAPITVNRTAPLINVQDSVKGNTIPVSAMP